jgi:GST-like protein
MIELYTWGTGNGRRAAIALAESGLAHRVRKVDLGKGAQKDPEYLKINPAGQIPALVDPEGPGGAPIALAQSGAIVLYAAEKSGRMMPRDPARRLAALQWFMYACSDVAGTSSTIFHCENSAPEKNAATIAFFKGRLATLFGFADARLAGREYLAEEFSVADVALYPVYAQRKELAAGLANLARWGERMAARPGVQQGMSV